MAPGLPRVLESTTETISAVPGRPVQRVRREACLVQIYPTGPTMGMRYPLGAEPVLIGRGPDCVIRVEEHSVSRRHSRVEPSESGHRVVDLQSTNGTFVNNEAVTHRELHDGDYLRVGNCIFRFLAGGNIEAEYHEEIYRLTIIDALTGVANRRCLLEVLARELVRSSRHRRPLALVLLDIDHFKALNDQHGHLAGDHVLRELAGRLKPAVRAEEVFARYGGEEFAVVVPECTAEGARVLAERLRRLVEAEPFVFDTKPLPVTISLGVAAVDGSEALTADRLLHLADASLYEAKRGGRNRVAG
jgi:diguanylate cyclase (GGDEF)-like protein